MFLAQISIHQFTSFSSIKCRNFCWFEAECKWFDVQMRHHNGREFMCDVGGDGLTWECTESLTSVGPFPLPFQLKYPILAELKNQIHTNWMGKLKLFTHALSCALSTHTHRIDCVHRFSYWIVFDLRKHGMDSNLNVETIYVQRATKVHIAITPFTPRSIQFNSIQFQKPNTKYKHLTPPF